MSNLYRTVITIPPSRPPPSVRQTIYLQSGIRAHQLARDEAVSLAFVPSIQRGEPRNDCDVLADLSRCDVSSIRSISRSSQGVLLPLESLSRPWAEGSDALRPSLLTTTPLRLGEMWPTELCIIQVFACQVPHLSGWRGRDGPARTIQGVISSPAQHHYGADAPFGADAVWSDWISEPRSDEAKVIVVRDDYLILQGHPGISQVRLRVLHTPRAERRARPRC